MISKKYLIGGVACVLLSSGFASADDELVLCGTVQGYDITKNQYAVDVTSLGCSGVRRFVKANDISGSALIKGKELCFYIDSNECKEGYVYSITEIEEPTPKEGE